MYSRFSAFKMAVTQDRGIRIAIDVSCSANRLLGNTIVLMRDREEVHLPIALVTREAEEWKMT